MHAMGTCSRYVARYAASSSFRANLKIPARGVVAPTLMLVAVRASAPVCGKPFSSGATMLTQPWPQSSLFGLNGCPRLSASRSAMREQSRLSIAATKTMAAVK